jgi:hypothetical protein
MFSGKMKALKLVFTLKFKRQPWIWDSEATKEAAEQQPSTSTRRLSDTLGPSKSTIHRHLTTLGKIYKSCGVVETSPATSRILS